MFTFDSPEKPKDRDNSAARDQGVNEQQSEELRLILSQSQEQ